MTVASVVSMKGSEFAAIRKAHSEGKTQESFAKYLNRHLNRRYDNAQVSRWERELDAIPSHVALFLRSPGSGAAISRRIEMLIVAVANQKGGVGKTTSTVNLAYLLASMGYRVLVVDADPQGNATYHLGVQSYQCDQIQASIYHVLLKDVPIAKAIQKVCDGKMDLLPSSQTLYAADAELMADSMGGTFVLREKLQDLKGQYDVVVIDCPPNLGLLTVNALNAAHTVMIPVNTEPMAVLGVPLLHNTVNKIRKRMNQALSILGILPTRYNKGHSIDRATLEDIHAIYEQGDSRQMTSLDDSPVVSSSERIRVWPPVPATTQYPQGSGTGYPTLFLAPNAPGAEAYAEVANAIVEYMQVEETVHG